MSDSTNADPELPAQLKGELIHLLNHSHSRIMHCVSQLDESGIWWKPADGLNSIGNLLLHLAGNLRQWAVAGILMQPDHRDREREFQADGSHSGEQLTAELRRVVDAAIRVISDIPNDLLTARRTIQGFDVTVLSALMHTVSHFVGHTHQIVLLTRMQLGDEYRYHWTLDEPRDKVPL